MKTLFEIISALIVISCLGWPIAHSKHNCPPKEEWKDTICPQAQVMEAFMFLQFGAGMIIFMLLNSK